MYMYTYTSIYLYIYIIFLHIPVYIYIYVQICKEYIDIFSFLCVSLLCFYMNTYIHR